MPFIDRLRPAPRQGGFSLPDHHVWCGSCIRDTAPVGDGRYHLFASVWSNRLPFHPHWVTNSRIVRAVSDAPEGPYTLLDEVLGPTPQAVRDNRFSGAWDGLMTHNPSIHRAPDGRYLLFYIGTRYNFPRPTPEEPYPGGVEPHELFRRARMNQRIGLAIADRIEGPWRRSDAPILDANPRPGSWDAFMTTNPAPCIRPDGSAYLAYKSTAHHGDLLRYGIAFAEDYRGPYRRLRDTPIFDFPDVNGQPQHIEDACIWHDGERFNLLMKDMNGGICGERHGGVHATSPDAVEWALSDPPLAYSRRVRWDDGTVTTQGHLERPQLLFDNPDRPGEPTHLFFATCDDPRGFEHAGPAARFWNLCVPLAADPAARPA